MTPRFAPHRSIRPDALDAPANAGAPLLPDPRSTWGRAGEHLSRFMAAGGIRPSFEFRREAGTLHASLPDIRPATSDF